jgi:hypothetical protein
MCIHTLVNVWWKLSIVVGLFFLLGKQANFQLIAIKGNAKQEMNNTQKQCKNKQTKHMLSLYFA